MLIATGDLQADTLAGRVAVVTGSGRGVGFETARALLWLGAAVVVAEIDETTGQRAVERLRAEFPYSQLLFARTDVGEAAEVKKLHTTVMERFGRIDILINNATVAPLGSVLESQISDWDRSYQVNLRGPVLLAQAFLPEMIVRNSGVFMCISSVGQAYMGPYETLKTAQVELADTLEAELTASNISVLTVGPGFVPTETALKGLEFLAGRMGMTVKEMRRLVAESELSIEAAGAGVAAAAALAERFKGLEIGAAQALAEAGIHLSSPVSSTAESDRPGLDLRQVQRQAQAVRSTLSGQAAGWQQRSFFERQWLARNFKKQAGMPVDQWLARLEELEKDAARDDRQAVLSLDVPLNRLADFYTYLQQAARGYVKDPAELESQLAVVDSWRLEVLALQELLTGEAGSQAEENRPGG